MDERSMFNQILAVLNAWADADVARIVAMNAEMRAALLPRMPPVLPGVRRRGEGPRAMRQRNEPRPEPET